MQGSSTFFAKSPLFGKCGTKSPPERIDPLKSSEQVKSKKRSAPVAHPRIGKRWGHKRECGGETPSRRRIRGFGGIAPSRQQIFYRFHKTKTLILAHFFTEKGHAVRTVTIDSAKIFSQLMSKSGCLLKKSERRLQPLLT